MQDADSSEGRVCTHSPINAYTGTGFWAVVEGSNHHAHFFRIASADRAQVVENVGEDLGSARKQQLDGAFRMQFAEELWAAVCSTTLPFTQEIALASEGESSDVPPDLEGGVHRDLLGVHRGPAGARSGAVWDGHERRLLSGRRSDAPCPR